LRHCVGILTFFSKESEEARVSKHTKRGTHRRAATFDSRVTKLPGAKDLAEMLREKARQRLREMPAPVKRAIDLGGSAIDLMLTPVRMGVRIVRDVLAVPAALLRTLAHKEV
jgi:hypothetical protein